MKVLSIEEMNDVSGAYSWGNGWMSLVYNAVELVASATLAASLGAVAGAMVGGKHGGDGGGILGFGQIGQGVGMIGAGAITAVGLGIAGAVIGWDSTYLYATKGMEGIFNGTWIA